MPDQRHILIGRILGAHGTGGNLKLLSYADSLETFAAARAVLIVCSGGYEAVYPIRWVKPHGRSALLSLQGVKSRTEAEVLTGCDLFIDKSTLPELEDGTYYWSDLIGLEVYSVDGAYIGRLESIFQTGSNDVYVVKHTGREVLIPALKSVVIAVDLRAQRMEVDLPEGLA